MRRIKKSALRKAIRRNMFETTYNVHTTDDKIAGKLGDERASDLTVPESQPIQPLDQTAAQLSRETYPVDDAEWMPQNSQELSGAVEQIARTCPDSQMDYFYNSVLRLLDKAMDQANNPKVASGDVQMPGDIDAVIKPKKKKVEENYYRGLKKFIDSLNESARKKDSARKWKQGDRLDLYRGDDDYDFDDDYGDGDYDDYDAMEDEFVPDVDDLRDFMEDNPDADLTQVPGAEEAIRRADPTTLEDLIKIPGALPNVRGASGARQYIDRTIFDLFRMDAETLDEFNKFTQGKEMQNRFVDALVLSDIIDKEAGEQLRGEQGLTASAMYREWLNDNFVQPAIRAYRATGKRKGVKGKELVNKVEGRWLAMSNPQRITATKKSMKNLSDFMDSEAGSQVSDWSKRAPTRF